MLQDNRRLRGLVTVSARGNAGFGYPGVFGKGNGRHEKNIEEEGGKYSYGALDVLVRTLCLHGLGWALQQV